MSGGQPPAYVAQGQQSTTSPVVTVSGQEASRPDGPTGIKKRKVHKGLHVTGLIQVAIGLTTVFLGLVHIVLNAPMAHVGCPIWCGMLFLILPGVIGVTAACKRDRCTITAYMVLAIVGSMATVAIITLAAMSAGFDRSLCRYSYSPDSATCLSSHEARVAVGVLLCLLAFTDAVVAIVGAGMSCGALCCSTGHSTPQPNVMVYYTPGPQMTVPQQSAMSNPAYGGPPQYEEAIHDPVVGAQGGAEAKDVNDHYYAEPYPIKVKPADLGSQI